MASTISETATDEIAIALAQVNFTVGDLEGNTARIAQYYERARKDGADLIMFPEMAIVGYPPEDVVLRPEFQQAAMRKAEEIARMTADGPAMLLGGIWHERGALYNTAFFMAEGCVSHRQYKGVLPNYGVFDEKRVFEQGEMSSPLRLRNMNIGLLICEDVWRPEVALHLARQGAEVLVVINASPFERDKRRMRMETARTRTGETGLPLIYVNQTGGQDELAFDGESFVMAADGSLATCLASFREDYAVTRWHRKQGMWHCLPGELCSPPGEEESLYEAAVLALRDYVGKNGFPGVLLGLSGGVDSALVAAMAVDALGADRVRAVMLPSPYTSKESLEDASACARLLGIALDIVPISSAMLAFDDMLAPLFTGTVADITEENIQSRIRGATLMALSNKFGQLLLTTGNKSEMAVGYATLYGDMCGGYNPLKDLYKTQVYALAAWRNGRNEVIPGRILTKAPSAELRPNQTDQDSLPPYEILDAILERLVERQEGIDRIIKDGFDPETVCKVALLLRRAEYKRRQAAPGVKLTSMSFGRDRRYPLTNRWDK